MAMIKCPECGKDVSDQAVSCPNCGAAIKKKQSVVGVIGFILSIIGLFLGINGGIILWTISIILCIIGCLEKDKKHGFAIVGNIISFIFLLCFVFLFIVMFK